MTDTFTIQIADGHATFIYRDDLAELLAEGPSKVTRASHVEPHPTRVGWLADMRPSGGPVIGRGWERTPSRRQASAARRLLKLAPLSLMR